MHKRQSGWLLAAGVVVLWGAFALRVWELGSESIWHDEGWSIRAIQNPFGTPDDNTPYVYYTILHLLWQSGSGESPFAFRFGSVLIGLLTVAIALQVGQRWLGTVTGVAFGVLVASSPLLWEYAQEVRAYVAVPLAGLVLLWLGSRLLDYPSGHRIPRRLWIAIFGVELVGLYTHNLVVALVAWLSVAVGIVWLLRRDWFRIWAWGALHLGLLVAYVPWLLTQSPSGTKLNTAPEPGFALLQDIWYSYFLPVLPQLQTTDNNALLNILAVVMVVATFALIALKPTVQSWLLVSFTLLVPLFSTVILIAASIDFHPRYYIAAVPGTLLLLVSGVQVLAEQLPAGRLVPLGAVVGVALLISQQSLSEINTTRAYQHDDFAGVAAYYATLPANAVIVLPFAEEPALQNYFAEQYDIQAHFVNIPLYSTEDTVIREISALVQENPRHVEFLTWFQLPADIRGMYPCLLGASSAEIGTVQTFFGLSTQQFMLAGTPDLQPVADALDYPVATMQSLDYAAGPAGVCLRSQWRTHTATAALQVAMRIYSPSYAWQIAEHNTTLRNAEQVADLPANATSAAYHFMQLPTAAPLQPYPVELTLYSKQQPQGFDVVLNNEVVGKGFRPTAMIAVQGPAPQSMPHTTQLVADNMPSGTIESGQTLRAEILLASDTNRIVLQGQGWQRVHLAPHDATWPAQRVWINFSTPADSSGVAVLLAGDMELRRYDIARIARVFSPPDTMQSTTSATFGNFAQLVGYSVNNPLDITLYWKAQGSSTIPYTVFVQLLSPDGRVVAQSDRPPANGQRPTTGWLAEEYIIDNHPLALNVDTYEGPVNVIVGFYDAETFERVSTTANQDAFQLPSDLVIN